MQPFCYEMNGKRYFFSYLHLMIFPFFRSRPFRQQFSVQFDIHLFSCVIRRTLLIRSIRRRLVILVVLVSAKDVGVTAVAYLVSQALALPIPQR